MNPDIIRFRDKDDNIITIWLDNVDEFLNNGYTILEDGRKIVNKGTYAIMLDKDGNIISKLDIVSIRDWACRF